MTRSASPQPFNANRPVLGRLSECYESGGRGPGTVSSGQADPGGVSYGLYQFASRTGTVAAFLDAEGAPWRAAFGAETPGRPGFGVVWQAIAARDPDGFAAAQHAFIERTHYRPVIAAVLARTGLDLARCPAALRDVAWSCAVQHAAAARIIAGAVAATDATLARGDPAYPAALVRAVYAARSAYLGQLGVRLGGPTQTLFAGIVARRYPAECAAALAQLAAEGGAA
ncbi:hypothetical protein [Novosphingobium sp.]|uniref:VgrG-related protein n=1 Tax=Novosphingobium sp. TaxID=1874826 RepID=UPI0026154134|nr:hypothetical protein [Novosphingobium sp.]